MAKLDTSYVPKNFRIYLPTAMRNVIDIKPGDAIDWYFGTDIDARKIVNNEGTRQQVIVIHVREP